MSVPPPLHSLEHSLEHLVLVHVSEVSRRWCQRARGMRTRRAGRASDDTRTEHAATGRLGSGRRAGGAPGGWAHDGELDGDVEPAFGGSRRSCRAKLLVVGAARRESARGGQGRCSGRTSG
jgi:hypothetical protein